MVKQYFHSLYFCLTLKINAYVYLSLSLSHYMCMYKFSSLKHPLFFLSLSSPPLSFPCPLKYTLDSLFSYFADKMKDLFVLKSSKENGTRETLGISTFTVHSFISFLNLYVDGPVGSVCNKISEN